LGGRITDVATGRIRYWAAAKAAAGVAEERYDAASLAEALAAARAAHAAEPRFAEVLARCSYVVDGAPVGARAHAEVALTDGGTVEVLPPFAGGSPGLPADRPVRALDGPRLVPPALTVGLAGLLALASYAGPPVLLLALLLVQAVLVGGWYGFADVPGERGGVVVALGAAAGADAVLLLQDTDPPTLAPLAGVVGLVLVAALLHQLLRRDGRPELTASLSATVALGGVVALGGGYLVAREARAGVGVLAAVLAGVAVGTVLAALPGPRWLSGALSAAGGAAVGGAVGSAADLVGAAAGAGLGLTGGALAGVAATMTSYAAGEPPARLAVAGTLPLVLGGSAAYVAGRLLVG